MSALEEKIFEKMKEYTLASFATIAEDNKPWTRYVVVKADEQYRIEYYMMNMPKPEIWEGEGLAQK
ncbi:hypothetical protein D1BOALGB6SA_1398 [Olavius sp. associated proteobacterium Delta 1]|nr:hypothetical protein D1BOALGB6SA_1398 [Olavius sp. associated proteobacterium Delta 1]